MAGDSHTTSIVLVPGHEIIDGVIKVLVKCLNSEHSCSVEDKQLIYFSEAVPLLIHLLSTALFDIRNEVAYVLGNLCVAPTKGDGKLNLIHEHLVSFVQRGCLSGFIDLVRSTDIEAARLGLQFMEFVLRGMSNGESLKLVELDDGIDAMERYQFHENEDLRNMTNGLDDKYFRDDYGVDKSVRQSRGTGEAITFYTEDDVPYLRNIANVMAASGCEVPSWIMALRKLRWKKHRPKR
ncbi:hypothetical protein REPUB_Repub13aG0012000 [Reevesia pubescens]